VWKDNKLVGADIVLLLMALGDQTMLTRTKKSAAKLGESRETSTAEQRLKAWRPGWPAAFRLFTEAAGAILTSRMPPIFRGLPPEESPRLVAAQALGVSPGNDFALLDRLGGDVAGALQLLPEGELPPVFSPAFEMFALVR